MSEKGEPRSSQNKLQKILIYSFITVILVVTFFIGYGIGIYKNTQEPSGQQDGRFSTLESVYKVLTEKFYYGSDSEEYRQKLVEDAIKGMVDAQGDPHTSYMTPAEVADFTESLESSFVGIGISYKEYLGNVLVVMPLQGSPAEEAGILPGDFITAIDGVKCSTLDEDGIVAAIRGKTGTSVVLTVEREGKSFEVTVPRAEIQSTVSSRIRDDVGIITIRSFGTGTADELGTHLALLEKEKVRKIIIDLRNNGGGYANTLDAMCAYFMETGEVVMREEYRDGQEIIDKVKSSKKIAYDRMIILLNSGSASCSEVFTLALTEHCGAITVGTTTYGKGVAQVPKYFSDGSALKYTDVIWKSDSGVSIDKVGITPDYYVELDPAMYLPLYTLEEDESYEYDSVSVMTSAAQKILCFLGYQTDRTDGYFSASTREMILKFAADFGLQSSGELNRQIMAMLNSRMTYIWAMEKDAHDTQLQKAMELMK